MIPVYLPPLVPRPPLCFAESWQAVPVHNFSLAPHSPPELLWGHSFPFQQRYRLIYERGALSPVFQQLGLPGCRRRPTSLPGLQCH